MMWTIFPISSKWPIFPNGRFFLVDHYTVDLFSISGLFFRGRFFRGPYFLNSTENHGIVRLFEDYDEEADPSLSTRYISDTGVSGEVRRQVTWTVHCHWVNDRSGRQVWRGLVRTLVAISMLIKCISNVTVTSNAKDETHCGILSRLDTLNELRLTGYAAGRLLQ